MVGIWQLLMLSHIVLFVICLILLIKCNTSFIHKLLWIIFMFFFIIVGNISFLIWRNCHLNKNKH